MDPLIFGIFIVAFIGSVILHEIAHGAVANYFGDDTARVAGRLSLNPIVHIDPIGSLLVPFFLFISNTGFLFGWAKPVPVNPHRLKGGAASYRWVTLAGITTNFVLAIIAALVLKVTTQQFGMTENNLGVLFFAMLMQINLVLGVFNLVPFPGFDGWNLLTTFSWFSRFIARTPLGNPMFMAQWGLFVSIGLLFLFLPAVSNLFLVVFRLFNHIFGL